MVILMHKKSISTKQTSNYQSQTDLPQGVSVEMFFALKILFIRKIHQIPIPFNGSDSIESVIESNQPDDIGYTFHQKTSKHYILKSNNRKNRVEFADVNLSSDDEDETSRLLTKPVN